MAAYTTTSNAVGIPPDDHGPLVVQPALNASVFATLSGIQTYVNAGAFGNLDFAAQAISNAETVETLRTAPPGGSRSNLRGADGGRRVDRREPWRVRGQGGRSTDSASRRIRRPAGGSGTAAVAAYGALGWSADAGLSAGADRGDRKRPTSPRTLARTMSAGNYSAGPPGR